MLQFLFTMLIGFLICGGFISFPAGRMCSRLSAGLQRILESQAKLRLNEVWADKSFMQQMCTYNQQRVTISLESTFRPWFAKCSSRYMILMCFIMQENTWISMKFICKFYAMTNYIFYYMWNLLGPVSQRVAINHTIDINRSLMANHVITQICD